MDETGRAARMLLLPLAACMVLSACAGSSNISRIPAQVGQESQREGLFTQPVKWTHAKPGCDGECPKLTVDSVVFPGVPRLTELVDRGLAYMTGIGASTTPPYSTIAEYEQYFWKTAGPRDETQMVAKARYRNNSLTVVELDTWQYMTGMAHGIPATQFINWDNRSGRALNLQDILLPGKRSAYIQALKQAYQRWLIGNPAVQNDPQAYQRMWPFQESENFGFTDSGLVVKYNAYEIAPYASGQPELVIPYSALGGILKPAFLPA
ncbi:DUF3298 domain-containing protein [Allopusillimonas soli]|uniref:DUF3298 domain-containing protein n=2 Tax=Allopusillimonas soli TaxID=659016 RepID=A0A853FAS0_9BURK|nr:DUF3298 domain-containing protein [Allopusillimonas soli]TEA75621.1 DUF3298 domain-containing protein [Allopusillimonas soli]